MKILMTSNYKLGAETGSSQVADLLARELSKKNKVVYICPGKNYLTRKINPNLTIIEFPSLEIMAINIPLFTLPATIKVFKAMESFMPDIVHLHNSISISSLVRILANYLNLPIVVTFHHIPTKPFDHLIPQLSKTELSKVIHYFYQKTTLQKFLQKIDAVIALNKEVYKSIRSVDSNVKLTIINNGLNLNKYLSIKPRTQDGKFKFIFVGSYTDRKNQVFLIKTFKHLPENYVLKCYGKIYQNSPYYNMLSDLILKDNIKNVFLNDFVDRNLIYKKYEACDYFISASKAEAQSLVVIQALASGKPVIALTNETINELITNNNGLKVEKKTSPKKFASLIKKYVTNINYEKISINARSGIDKFKIENVILKTQNFYKSICQSHSKNGRGNISQKDYKILSKLHMVQK